MAEARPIVAGRIVDFRQQVLEVRSQIAVGAATNRSQRPLEVPGTLGAVVEGRIDAGRSQRLERIAAGRLNHKVDVACHERVSCFMEEPSPPPLTLPRQGGGNNRAFPSPKGGEQIGLSLPLDGGGSGWGCWPHRPQGPSSRLDAGGKIL